MAGPRTSTCSPWATPADLVGRCNAYGADAGLQSDALQAASDELFRLSGRQWPGVCSAKVRPTAQWGAPSSTLARLAGSGASWLAFGWDPSWGWCTCNRAERYGCGTQAQISLGVDSIIAVSQVKIDGTVLDPSLYEVRDHRWLQRLPDANGNRPGWPCCQPWDLPDTQPGTWSVSFTFGPAPPIGGKLACAALACEIMKAVDPSLGECKLPTNAVSVTRQGITVQLLDPTKAAEANLTGIGVIDRFLRSVNPAGLQRRATATSPDVGRRTTSTTWPP